MRFYKVREAILQGKSITTLPLRVTFYARVSTDSDEQLNSLENQISYFKEYITTNPNWIYVDGYIDEGISGSSVKKRKHFLRMIDDAKNGCFDLIITKEVSRFSRNLSDSIKYTQELMTNDVGVYFQSNGINTYDPNSEFILNMMGSVAQEEVKRLSSRVKWGHSEAIKRGRVLGSNSITGYKKDNAKLVIVEEEAKVVRKIFELYATGNYGFCKLAMELHKQGIDNSKGKIYDKDTLKRIIENPKYKGFYSGHTTETIDYRTKKRVYIPKEERIIYRDENIPAIVSEELWNRANEILESRSNVVKNKELSNRKTERKYAYSGKIFCSEHNFNFQRSTGSRRSKKPRWACGYYMKYRLEACESPIIAEMDLDNIFSDIMNKIFENKNSIINEMMSYYSNLKFSNTYQNELKKVNNKIDDIKIKKDKVLELNINGNISNLEFQERNDEFNEEIANLKKKITALEKDLMPISTSNLKNVESAIKKQLDFKTNIQSFVETFVNEIIVSKIDNDRQNIKLDIFLNLIKKPKVATKGSRYLGFINENLSVYSSRCGTLDLGRTGFKRNTFTYNVYLNKIND